MTTSSNSTLNIFSLFPSTQHSTFQSLDGSTLSISQTTRSLQVTLIGEILNELRNLYRTFILPFVIIIGIIGNLLILIVFIFQPNSVTHTSTFYNILLALADLVSLLTYHLDQFLSKVLNKFPMENCVLISILHQTYYVEGIDIFFLPMRDTRKLVNVIFTIERIIEIRSPFKVKKYFSRARSTMIITILALFHAVLYITLFWAFGLVQDGIRLRCLILSETSLMNAIYEGFIIPNSHFIPIIGNAILNSILVDSIRKAIEKRAELTLGYSHLKIKEYSITKTIAIVQTIHLVIYFPSGIFWLIRAIMQVTPVDDEFPLIFEAFYNGSLL